MYNASIQNRSGELYLLDGQETRWQISRIKGLNPPKGQINMTTIVGLDGAVYNSSKLQTRNIVITVKITGQVEQNRLDLYRAFRTKEWCRFFYKNGSVNVWIDGYVESVECDLFEQKETAQISILCPSPYFKSVQEVIADISSRTALFKFPFSIDSDDPIPFSTYESDATATVTNSTATPTGVIIEMDFVGAVTKIVVQNTDTGEHITLNYSFQADDHVVINTNPGEKSVKLIRNGVTTSIFSAVELGSVFFQLQAGANEFGYLANNGNANGNVYVLFRFYNQYRGV